MADNFSIKYFMEILILVLFGLGASVAVITLM